MAADGGVPATRRLISERLRGRFSEPVFVCIRDSKLEMDRGGWGGAKRKGFLLLLPPVYQLFIHLFDLV